MFAEIAAHEADQPNLHPSAIAGRVVSRLGLSNKKSSPCVSDRRLVPATAERMSCVAFVDTRTGQCDNSAVCSSTISLRFTAAVRQDS